MAARDRAAATAQTVRTGVMNWLSTPPGESFQASIKVRYRQPDQAATVSCQPDGGVRIRFETPQWAVTPGQTAAIYLHQLCLGGGVIEESL